ncbi:MAG: PAS domain S-box protein [Nitrospiraceae bacterium]|nr:PAS domain S-box protein [Nitrospiraceae bacterium]
MIRREDRKPLFLEYAYRVFFQAAGRLLRAVAGIRGYEDDLKAAIRRADEEKAKFASIVAAIGDGISIQDTCFNILYQNPVLISKVNEHIGERCYQAYEHNCKVCGGCPLEMTFKDGGIHRVERKVLTERGPKYLEITASPLRDPTGRTIAGIEVVRDVTDRWESHMALQETAETLRSLVEASPLAVIAVSMDGTVTLWNSAAERIFGWSKEQVLGLPNPIIPEDKKTEFGSILERVGNGGSITGQRFRRMRKDGSLVDISLSASPMRDGNGKITGTMALLEDITDRVKLEDQIAADVADKRKAEEKIKTQLDRLKALRNIDMAITGSFDLRVTLNILLDEVQEKLGVDAADVLLYDPQMMTLEHAASKGFRTEAIRRLKLNAGETCAGHVAIERKSFIYPDIFKMRCGGFAGGELTKTGHAFPQTHLVLNEGFKAYFGVPLMVKGRVKGVLEIFHRSTFSPDDGWLEFLDSMAGQAAMAIDNALMLDELQKSNDELTMAYDTTIEGWSRALDYRDAETEGHSQRVTEMAVRIAGAFGIKGADLVHIRRGALLHDIGKLGVPDHILHKRGALTAEEWEIMRKHPEIAFELLSPIKYLEPAIVIPYYHHEKWNGSGYPVGLKGKQIPLAARIFAVVDVWDALCSDRPYRKAWTEEKTKKHIESLAGQDFDPEVVEIFLKTINA